MAAILAERREARRRRILENSQDRFNKILNINNYQTKDDLCCQDREGKHQSNFENEINCAYGLQKQDGSHIENALLTKAKLLPQLIDSNLDDSKIIGVSDLEQLFEDQHLQGKSQSGTESEEFNYKHLSLHEGFVIFLAFVVFCLLIFNEFYEYLINISIIKTCLSKIFMPILLYEVICLLFVRETRADTSFITTLLLMGQRQRNKLLQYITVFFFHFRCILQDIILYFFSFVVLDLGTNYFLRKVKN